MGNNNQTNLNNHLKLNLNSQQCQSNKEQVQE